MIFRGYLFVRCLLGMFHYYTLLFNFITFIILGFGVLGAYSGWFWVCIPGGFGFVVFGFFRFSR